MQHTANTSALVAIEQKYDHMMLSLGEGLRFVEQATYEGDGVYTLFRGQDASAWITFSLVFVVLIFFDNFVLHRGNKALSVGVATFYTLFWVAMAGCFCGYIYWRFGHNQAFNWGSGYLLEWMLSFDNIFVFHLIFQVYGTPDDQKHKPLFWGICGAVFFRLVFLFIGEVMLHSMMFAHILFGGFLVYTGVQSVISDDEDEDPSKNWLVQFLSRRMPFVSYYDAKGSFFVKVPMEGGQHLINPETATYRNSQENAESEERGYGTIDFAANRQENTGVRTEWRATMLFLVVICLEVSDILFAVDSVSAIVAQVPDLFLAYTSAVFAMLGLRAMFFIVDELVKLFQFLKYGVAAILIFIGIKLILGKLVHVPPGIVCCILFGTLATSMVASWVYEKYQTPEKDLKA
jgi:tellurite resistance protein TerC